MAFLDLEKMLSKGISRAVEQAIKNKVLEAVMPKRQRGSVRKRVAEDEYMREARAAENRLEEEYRPAKRKGAERGSEAAQSSKSVKLCQKCGTLSPKKMKFCPECGTRLPDETLYEQNVAARPSCPLCGAFVEPGTKFCPECGAEILRAKNGEAAAVPGWPPKYAAFPKWSLGGRVECEELSDGLHVTLEPAGYDEFEAYRYSALDAGFRPKVREGVGECLWRASDGRRYEICGSCDEKAGNVSLLFSISE